MDIEIVYNEYFSVVYKYILSISKDPLTAEEISQTICRKEKQWKSRILTNRI